MFLCTRVGLTGVGLTSAAGPEAQRPEPPFPGPHSIIFLIRDPIYLYSAYHHRPFLGMRTWDHVLDRTPPSPAGPRRCHPPSHYKIYISICHISTPHLSRQASAQWALAPEPPLASRLPPTPGCWPRQEVEPSVAHLGLRVLLTRVRAQLSPKH